MEETLRGQRVLTTPNDVPASELVKKLATYLKENVDAVTPPAWASMAKTGMHVEKQPQDPDWWYVRSASLLRKIYVHGPVGIEKLRAGYGGERTTESNPATQPKGAARTGEKHFSSSKRQATLKRSNLTAGD
mgnify:CR=1 FL=1